MVAELKRRGRRRARKARLNYVNDFDTGWGRRACGKGFSYLSVHGRTMKSSATRKRIEALAIPPAWEDVWINPRSDGHILATGRDKAGRRQYIYHPKWQAISAATKYDRMQLLAELLPRIRTRVRNDLRKKGLPRNKVLAAVVRLIDKTNIRVGNQQYAEANGSRGATTLGREHVDIEGIHVSLDFPSKSGQQREIEFSDRSVARVMDRCEEIHGQYLFCYRDEHDSYCTVESADVNDYLQEISGQAITAKDFRTWSASVIALSELCGQPGDSSNSQRKRSVNLAIDEAAKALGNTKAVCRSSYIHPGILAAGETGELNALLSEARKLMGRKPRKELTKDERLLAATLVLLNS